MNREDIIRMAREAGAMPYTNRHYPDRPAHAFGIEQLERFAALVAAAEQKKTGQEIIMMSEHCAELILEEREACAEVCDRGLPIASSLSALDEMEMWGEKFAAAIRARGETK